MKWDKEVNMIFFPFYYPVQVYSVLCIDKMDNPILKRTHFFLMVIVIVSYFAIMQ